MTMGAPGCLVRKFAYKFEFKTFKTLLVIDLEYSGQKKNKNKNNFWY
jgi:hypothetical protein